MLELPLDNTEIVVTGNLNTAANNFIGMINLMGLASATPPGINMLFPPIGSPANGLQI